MRNCYNDIINNVQDSIALNSNKRASELKEQFSTEKMYEEFINCIVDLKDEQEKQEEVENLLNDLL